MALAVRPLRRTEYERLVDAGVFGDEPIELLDGALVEMSPEGGPHHWLIQELNHVLSQSLSEDLRVRIGHPWAADDISEPEPDLAIVALADFDFPDAPSTALLLIEVAHSSRAKDLGAKARIYGSAGVPVYWVVDLRDQVVHVHTRPTATGYDRVERVGFDTTLDAVGVPVRLAELLPDR